MFQLLGPSINSVWVPPLQQVAEHADNGAQHAEKGVQHAEKGAWCAEKGAWCAKKGAWHAERGARRAEKGIFGAWKKEIVIPYGQQYISCFYIACIRFSCHMILYHF